MTLNNFSNTGKIIPLEVFKKKYADFEVHPECTDVVVYINKFYIQMLKSGNYFFKYNVTKKKTVEIELNSLDIVESLAWDNFISNKF